DVQTIHAATHRTDDSVRENAPRSEAMLERLAGRSHAAGIGATNAGDPRASRADAAALPVRQSIEGESDAARTATAQLNPLTHPAAAHDPLGTKTPGAAASNARGHHFLAPNSASSRTEAQGRIGRTPEAGGDSTRRQPALRELATLSNVPVMSTSNSIQPEAATWSPAHITY